MWYFVAKHYSVIQKNIPFPHFCTFCAFYFLSSFFVFVAVFWIPFSNFHTICRNVGNHKLKEASLSLVKNLCFINVLKLLKSLKSLKSNVILKFLKLLDRFRVSHQQQVNMYWSLVARLLLWVI